MPEGHTIHALAARLNRTLGRQPIRATSPQGRFAADAALLDGHTLDLASARGKHLFVEVEDLILHVHLGLIGSFHVKPRPDISAGSSPPRLRLEGVQHVAELRGPMICALVDEAGREAVLGKLGPDPLHESDVSGGAERAWLKISKSRRTIAELLLDQSAIAGIGNVYRCEVLYRHRVDPLDTRHGAGPAAVAGAVGRPGPAAAPRDGLLPDPDRAGAPGRGRRDGGRRFSARHHHLSTGERLGDHFNRRFHVYQRTGEPCDRCGRRIRSQVVGGRTLYWCPGCRRRRRKR